MRYAKHRDQTEADIIAAYRRIGALVLVLDAFDLLVYWHGRLYMVEVKTAKSRTGRIVKQQSQQKLEAAGWPLRYVRNVDEAFAVIGIGG